MELDSLISLLDIFSPSVASRILLMISLPCIVDLISEVYAMNCDNDRQAGYLPHSAPSCELLLRSTVRPERSRNMPCAYPWSLALGLLALRCDSMTC